MKKNIIFLFILGFVASCASVIDGRKQQMSFDSNEKHVEIYINGKFTCQTPCMSEVKRSQKQLMVTAKKTGFEDKTVFLNKNLNSSSAFNVISLWTSTFGFTTDKLTDSIWEYQPNAVYVFMEKEPKTDKEIKKSQERNKIREFVLRNFEQLQADTYESGTTGEYIKTLVAMGNFSALDVISIVRDSYVATDCAERIAGLYQ